MSEEINGQADAAIETRLQRPRVSSAFVAPAALLSGVVGFVASQIGMVVAAAGDMSFWGFAIMLSGVFAVVASFFTAMAGLIAVVAAGRWLRSDASPRRVVLGAIVAGLPLAVFAIFLGIPMIVQGSPVTPIAWVVVAVTAVAGGAMAGGAVRNRPPAN